MFLTILTLLSGIVISVIAAGYSIMGLATLFSGAVIPIMAMGGALEIGKLVVASWLYRNWHSSLLPRSIRYYLTISVVILIFITSIGIFGFLSKAHLDQVKPSAGNYLQIDLLNKQIKQQQIIIDRSQKTIDSLDKALEKYIDMEYVTKGLQERQKQAQEREALQKSINVASTQINQLSDKKYKLESEQLKIEAEVGPLKYVAELIYGKENARDHFDEAVRLIIIILIFVFDPLAVLMLIAANISLRERSMIKNIDETKNKEKVEYQLKRLQKQNKNMKSVKKMMKEVGITDPNEIKIKLNQIMDLNKK